MKVLFNMHPTGFQTGMFGGAQLQLLKTAESLKKLGVFVKKFNMFEDKIENFDIFHNFEMNRDTYNLYLYARKKGIKVALSTIYWKCEDLLFSDEGIKAFGRILFEKLGRLYISKLNPFFRIYPYKGFLCNADIILPNSKMEADLISKRFNIPRNKFFVVPNGVDKKFYKAKPNLFQKKYNKKDFVLFVGRIEPRKNLLKMIRAVKKLNIPTIIIGDAPFSNDEYLRKCKIEAKGADIKFLGSFPPESNILKSAYASAKVFCLPSFFETPGLVALEAGLAGANIVITNKGSTTEYFKNFVEYCNPKSQKSIEKAIYNAYKKEKNSELKKHILKNYTWEHVAKKTLEAYKKIL